MYTNYNKEIVTNYCTKNFDEFVNIVGKQRIKKLLAKCTEENIRNEIGAYDTIPVQNRKISLIQTEDSFSEQEAIVIKYLRSGLNNAWQIVEQSGLLLTSVRRALTCLESKRIIEAIGRVYNRPTKRFVTAYSVINK